MVSWGTPCSELWGVAVCMCVRMCVCVCVGAGVSVFGGIMCAVCMQKCALVFDLGHRIGCQPMTIHAKNY